MTHYEPRPERPPPRQDGGLPVAIIMGVILGCALLMQCSEDADARGATVVVPGTIALTIINPPQPVSCAKPGWAFFYVATGTSYRAHSASYFTGSGPLVLELTPALDECIHVDGFEA